MSLCTPLSCTKITLSILDGASRLRFALTINPAVENTSSEGVLVAGIANMDLASMERHGKVCCSVDHHDSTSSAETDGGAPTDGRRRRRQTYGGAPINFCRRRRREKLGGAPASARSVCLTQEIDSI
jgi:hypothetical protein